MKLETSEAHKSGFTINKYWYKQAYMKKTNPHLKPIFTYCSNPSGIIKLFQK